MGGKKTEEGGDGRGGDTNRGGGGVGLLLGGLLPRKIGRGGLVVGR